MVPLLFERDNRDAVGLWRAGRYARPEDRRQFADAVSRNHGARQRIFGYVMGAGAGRCPLAESNSDFGVTGNLSGEK